MNYVFPILSALLWGGNTLVAKTAASAIGPVEIAFIRWLLAAILLLPFAIKPLRQYRETIASNWWKLALLGMAGGVVYQTLAYTAAAYTSAINMGVIQALVPMVTIFMASVAFRTVPTTSSILGAIVSLAGVLLVISGGSLQTFIANGVNRGDAMMLLGVCSMGLYSTLLKRWHLEIPLIASMFCQAVCAATILLPFYVTSSKHVLTVANGSMILYATLAASIVAPLSWMVGTRRLGPARVALFFNLVPIVTAALAVVVLAERFTWNLLLGGALALIGVAIVEVMNLRRAAANKERLSRQPHGKQRNSVRPRQQV
ncbi:DMT family transporter [Burkholderia perseverans]|uniref:DMT family transporter n=1 Tax=Burkholderia perseverans TaxID=2615214 RepID=UPI001FF02719|nr:DMT family transporter [Burkholderia perseverans]